METNKIYHGDCLELMKQIPDESIDMILCDLPYGTTACKWDTIIPFVPLWKEYERLIKPNGAIVLTASQPFTSALVMSNPELLKYDLVWIKSKPQGFAQAPYKFMNKKEDILIFSKGGCAKNAKNRMTFNPQGIVYRPKIKAGIKADMSEHRIRKKNQKDFLSEYTNYPNNILKFGSEFGFHPTQKPIALFEYLIKTYTNENDIVLDNCIGSGTTAIACINARRNYIGMEMDKNYFDIADKRIKEHNPNLKLF